MVNIINKKIIKEEKIFLDKEEYIKVTYEDGEVILKQYDLKDKMWIILKFNQNKKESDESIKNILHYIENYIVDEDLNIVC